MSSFKPSLPYNTAAEILTPQVTNYNGVNKKTYPESGEKIYCSFKTFGGTETATDGVYSIIDTAAVETWYRPDIKSNCAIKVLQTGALYEIIGEPENINMKNQYLKFTVRRVKGGA